MLKFLTAVFLIFFFLKGCACDYRVTSVSTDEFARTTYCPHNAQQVPAICQLLDAGNFGNCYTMPVCLVSDGGVQGEMSQFIGVCYKIVDQVAQFTACVSAVSDEPENLMVWELSSGGACYPKQVKTGILKTTSDSSKQPPSNPDSSSGEGSSSGGAKSQKSSGKGGLFSWTKGSGKSGY